jgi:hypothetical protein
MTHGYRLLVAHQVNEQIKLAGPTTRRQFMQLLRRLEENPFLAGEFQEPDEVGRPLEGVVLREVAVFFRADHADRETKVLSVRPADS